MERSVHRSLVKKIEERIGPLRFGNGLYDETDVGPLIHDRALARVVEHVSDASKAERTYEPADDGSTWRIRIAVSSSRQRSWTR